MSKAIRELLLRKTDNPNLRFLIQSASDKAIQDMVIESLEKMASYAGKKAIKMNAAVRDFLNNSLAETQAGEPSPMEHLRDALGHHASHYAAARQNGNQALAEEHAKQFLKLGHLAHKLDSGAKTIANFEPHDDMDYKIGMLDTAKFDAPDLQAWQATSPQHFANRHKSSGVDLPGWRAYQKQDGVRSRGDGVNEPNKFSFAWLANNPHPDHKDIGKHMMMGHDESGYPMEQVQVNGKHIPVGVVEYNGKYAAHPFDHHPIVSHFDESPEEHAPKAEQYKNKLALFHGGPHGLALATRGADLAHPDHGKEPGLEVHPKVKVESNA